MFLLFNTLSRFVTAFLTRKTCLSISWRHSPSTVVLEPKKIKSVTASTPPLPALLLFANMPILVFLNVEFQASVFMFLFDPHQFSSVQLLSRVQLFETPWTTERQASLSITNSQSLPKFMILIRMLLISSTLSTITVLSPAYLRLLIFLPESLIPAWDSSSPAFHTMSATCKLNRQGDNI